MGIPDQLACLLRNLCAVHEATVRTRHGTMDWLKIGKGVYQSCLLSSCLFNLHTEYIMWNAGLEEAQDGIKIARRNINDLRWCHPYCRKWRGTKEPLDESERGEWKTLLKINILKTKIMASGPNTSWQIDGETMETCRLYFLGLQNHCRWWLQPWKEKTLAPWKKSYDQPRQNIKKQKHYFADKGQ